jgi:hypothetical protein
MSDHLSPQSLIPLALSTYGFSQMQLRLESEYFREFKET